MDQTSFVTILCIVVFVFLFVVANKLFTARKLSRIQGSIRRFVDGLGFELSAYEHITDRIIGIDKKSGHLFFIQTSKKIECCIDLRDVQSCCIDEVARNVKSGKDATRVIEKLQFVFVPVDSKKILPRFVFFDVAGGDYAMAGEHDFLERWLNVVNSHLNQKS